jgi:hypothetical protein
MSKVEPQVTQVVSESDDAPLEVGDDILVRNRFLGTWTGGFRVAEVFADGFRLQRLSDNLVFPDVFLHHEVRREQRQNIRGSHLDRRVSGRWGTAPEERDSYEQWILDQTEVEDQ